MRVLASLMLVVFLVVSSVAFAQDGKVNFSGKWSLNNEKSQLPDMGNPQGMGGGQGIQGGQDREGPPPPDMEGTQAREGAQSRRNRPGSWMAAKELIINQAEDYLSVGRVSEGRDGKNSTVTENFTLDGKEKASVTSGGRSRKVTAKWSEEGKSITIISTMVFERDGNQMQMSTAETWRLSEDGNSLSIESVFQTPRGEIEATYVYDKITN